MLTSIALLLGGCWLSHVSEEGAAIAEVGDVSAAEMLAGLSSLATRVPVDDGCLIFNLSSGGTASPFELRYESNSRSLVNLRFTEQSCRDASAGICARMETARPVTSASGWLRAREDEAAPAIDIAGDIRFTADDGFERRVIIREQRFFTFLGC